MAAPIIKESAGHIVNEGDRVVFTPNEPQPRGRIENISRIFQRGPFEGGTRVTLVHRVDFLLPPGHHVLPVSLVVKNEEEIKEDERIASGMKPTSPLVGV